MEVTSGSIAHRASISLSPLSCALKYGTYPEYHTSRDDLSLITPEGMFGGFTALRSCIEVLEADRRFEASVLCEPHMKSGLYSTLGTTAGQ